MTGVKCLDFRGFGSQFLLTYTQLALKIFIPKTSNDQNGGVNLLYYDVYLQLHFKLSYHNLFP